MIKAGKLIILVFLSAIILVNAACRNNPEKGGEGGFENAPAGVELGTERIDAGFFDKRDDTAVSWLGMAGALVNSRGTIILIDPLITVIMAGGKRMCESGYRFRIALPIEAGEIPRADIVLYTHADNDHFGQMTAITLAERTDCKFIAPPPVEKELLKLGIDSGRIIPARNYASIPVGAVQVYVTPALHDWQKENPWKRGDCCGYLLRTPDGSIWHPGDTRLIDELFGVKNVDVLFFDVAAVNTHLGPAGSAKLAESSGAKVLIAYHYGTFDLPPGTFGSFDPKASLPYVQGLSAQFLQPNPGEIVRLPLGMP